MDGLMESRTPISHLAKAGATKTVLISLSMIFCNLCYDEVKFSHRQSIA